MNPRDGDRGAVGEKWDERSIEVASDFTPGDVARLVEAVKGSGLDVDAAVGVLGAAGQNRRETAHWKMRRIPAKPKNGAPEA